MTMIKKLGVHNEIFYERHFNTGVVRLHRRPLFSGQHRILYHVLIPINKRIKNKIYRWKSTKKMSVSYDNLQEVQQTVHVFV